MTQEISLKERVFLSLPLPISRIVYDIGRATFFKDARKPYFEMALKKAAESSLVGDYLEFGVYKGISLIGNYKLAQKYRLINMRFFAFDGFCGLPEGEGDLWEAGMFYCSKERFVRIIEKAGVDLGKLVIVDGLYEKTLSADAKKVYGLERAAIVHVDCDVYSSTTAVLSFIEPLIQIGTILIFDDWYAFSGDDRFGEKRAFQEWLLSKYFQEFYEYAKTKAFVYWGADGTPTT